MLFLLGQVQLALVLVVTTQVVAEVETALALLVQQEAQAVEHKVVDQMVPLMTVWLAVLEENTGSGGGGGSGNPSFPGLGGSGIVIIRYPMASKGEINVALGRDR
jgi:hypothetical protein